MTELFATSDGPAGAPPLLLLHGTGASGRSWSALVPRLATAHRVIRVDLPGCGQSPPDGDYDVDRQAARVGETLDRLGVTSAVVAGHSSGGAVATALAVRRPALVRGLALVDTGPGMDAYAAPAFPFPPSDWPSLTDDQLRAVLAQAFRPGFDIPPDAIAQIRATSLEAFAGTSRALRAYLTEAPLPDRLARLGRPLLIVFGAEDQRWRAASADDYRSVPGARIVVLPGVGHTPIIEAPAETAELLLSFAHGLEPGPSPTA